MKRSSEFFEASKPVDKVPTTSMQGIGSHNFASFPSLFAWIQRHEDNPASSNGQGISNSEALQILKLAMNEVTPGVYTEFLQYVMQEWHKDTGSKKDIIRETALQNFKNCPALLAEFMEVIPKELTLALVTEEVHTSLTTEKNQAQLVISSSNADVGECNADYSRSMEETHRNITASLLSTVENITVRKEFSEKQQETCVESERSSLEKKGFADQPDILKQPEKMCTTSETCLLKENYQPRTSARLKKLANTNRKT